jgi:hypothetical protein
MTLRDFLEHGADCGAKKFPASREFGLSAADRERDDFGPNPLPERAAGSVLQGGLSWEQRGGRRRP